MVNKNLARFFAPKSVAVIGVSRDTGKIGSTIFTNLIASGYQGKLIAINPKYNEVYGYKCYPDLLSVPYKVEMVIMSVPAPIAIEVIEQCHKKNVKNLIIISAGFKEVGGEGAKLEEKVKELAEKYGITILGPNTLGMIVTESNLNASFSAMNTLPGDVAFMSQSGAVCTAILDMANSENFGFSHFVSLGNKVNLSENELLEYWLMSDKVKAIGAYLEEFLDGYKFVTLKSQLKVNKPIVILNPGNSQGAQAAMKSHTGSLAGSKAIINAALEKHGFIIAENISECYSLLQVCDWVAKPQGDKVAIITNAGGAGIIATDIVEKYGLKMAELSDETKAVLREKLPVSASVNNPVDLIGDALADRYLNSLEVVASEKDVDIIFVILTPQLVTQIEETAKLLVNTSKQFNKPIVPVFIGGKYVSAGLNRLHDNKMVAFEEIDMAVKCMAKYLKYSQYLKNYQKKILKPSEFVKPSNLKLKKYTTNVLTALPEDVVQQIFEEYQFPVPPSGIIRSLEDALEFTKKHGYPIVLKATTEDVAHKTDFEAIFLNVNSPEMLKEKLTKLQENIYKVTKKDHPPVLIQKQITAKEELIVGVKRDGNKDVYESNGKGFGHLILFGKGGIYTEVYKDTANAFAPLCIDEINRLIDNTKVSQIINGVRGKKPLARKKLIEVINKIQDLIFTHPEIAEIDLNPVMITEKGCYLVDAKIFVQD